MADTRNGIPGSDGGIVSLAMFVEEHREAIEYDLLTLTGHELADVGRTLSWGALASFLVFEEAGSALDRDINGDDSIWSDIIKTNGILADIYDQLAQINANLVAIGSRSKSQPVKPYPRPGVEQNSGNRRHFGKGALPPDELEAWFEKKRKEYNGGRS